MKVLQTLKSYIGKGSEVKNVAAIYIWKRYDDKTV
jgi:hypothetical protein